MCCGFLIFSGILRCFGRKTEEEELVGFVTDLQEDPEEKEEDCCCG